MVESLFLLSASCLGLDRILKAAEWRRAVDRLSRLHTFLSPTEEAAAALKDVLRAGPGSSIIFKVYRNGYISRGRNSRVSCSGGDANLEDDDGRNMRHRVGSAAKGKRTVTDG